jgi:UPF0755 protein
VTFIDEMLSHEQLPPSRNAHSAGKRVVIGAGLMAVIAMVFGIYSLLGGTVESNDYVGSGEGSVRVVVSRGDSITQIGRTLQSADVIKSVESFTSAAANNAQSASIGPGQYTLRMQMSGENALLRMLDPESRSESRLVLPEGLRLGETITVAATATDLPSQDFDQVLENPDLLVLPSWAESRPEGFMFPATYDLAGDENAESILNTLVKRFNESANVIDLEGRAAQAGINPYEVLIIASLLEGEVVPKDFAKVSAVVYNRLEAEMALQFDSTVSYALGLDVLELSADQLENDSPYNTYVNTGLPPTPINSPGEAALEAALAPAKGKWLYFVTVNPDTGETKFAKTYDRFLKLKAQYRAYLDSR